MGNFSGVPFKLEEVVKRPEFTAMPVTERVKVLSRLNPDFARMSPDQQALVAMRIAGAQSVKFTTEGTRVTDIDAASPALPPTHPEGSKEMDSAFGEMNRPPESRAVETLGTLGPIAGGFGGGMAVGQGLLRRLAAAFLGGAAGESAAQLGEHAADAPSAPQSSGEAAGRIALQGGVQGAFEGGGAALTYPFRKFTAFRRAAALPENRAVAEMNTKLGELLTPPEVAGKTRTGIVGGYGQYFADSSALGGIIARESRERALTRGESFMTDLTSGQLARSFGGVHPTEPSVVGRGLQGIIRQADEVSKAAVDAASGGVTRLSRNVMVDMRPAKLEARRLLKEFDEVAVRFPQTGGAQPQTQKILTDTLTGPDQVPFEIIRDYRTNLRHLGPAAEELIISKQARGIANKFEGVLTNQLNDAAQRSGSPQLVAAWNRFRDLATKRGDLFQDSVVAKIIGDKSEDVMGRAASVSDIRAIRSAILDYATQSPDPAKRQVARDSWNMLRDNYARTLLKDTNGAMDLTNLKKRLGREGSEMLMEVFATDHQGRIFLHNLRDLSEVMSRMTPVPETRTMYQNEMVRGLLSVLTVYSGGTAGIPLSLGIQLLPAALSKVLHNPTATRMMIQGLERTMKNSPKRYWQAMAPAGRVADKAVDVGGSQVTATGLADIARAFQIALSADEPQPGQRIPVQ